MSRDQTEETVGRLDTALERCDVTLHPEIQDLLSRMRVGEQRHADWIAAQIEGIARSDS